MPVENVTLKKFITYMATEKSTREDGEVKYWREKPCGKCDVNKFLKHVQDNDIEVRCDNF